MNRRNGADSHYWLTAATTICSVLAVASPTALASAGFQSDRDPSYVYLTGRRVKAGSYCDSVPPIL